jgi:hypothetical protein
VKLYNKYLLTVAPLLLLTTVFLIALGQNALDIYLTVYIIEALLITELFVYFNKKARRGLAYVSTILFGGFIITLCLQIIRILA